MALTSCKFRSNLLLITASLIYFALAAFDAQAADATYSRLTTDRITVISSSGPKDCIRLARQVLVYERTLKDLANVQPDSHFPPLAIYSLSERDASRVFLNEKDKQEQRAKNMRVFSKYLPGQDFNVAAIVDVESGGDEPLQSVLLLYGQSILQSGIARRYPPWYQVGIANITNGLMIRDDGTVLINRNITFVPVVEKGAAAHTKYTLEKLLDTSPNDLSNSGDLKEFSRRAREWALYGLLTTTERKSKFHELAVLMRQGTPASEAIPQAFGAPLSTVEVEFDDGKWRRDLIFKIPAVPLDVTLPSAEKIDSQAADAFLSVVAERVQQVR
jgi:hypothetical protein